jgi:hypothetical protein
MVYSMKKPRMKKALGALLAIASLAAAAPAAHGQSYAPPKGKSFHGVSETGFTRDYKSFAKLTQTHSAVQQRFSHWGMPLTPALERFKRTRTRGVLSLSTAPGGQSEVISPLEIATGRGDKYMLLLNDEIAASKQIVYIRLMAEMNGHWNAYSAFNSDGSSRGKSHSTKSFKKAWKRFSIIVKGGPRNKINKRLHALDMPRLLRAKSNNDKVYNRLNVPKVLPKPKVALMWVPQTRGSPDVPGNAPSDYYPGAKYVDWVGADAYAKFANSTLWNNLNSFYRKYDNHPFVIGEYGPWDSDPNGAFTNAMFNWGQSNGRTRMLLYYRDVSATNVFNLQFYPDALNVLRQEIAGNEFVPIPAEYRGSDNGS